MGEVVNYDVTIFEKLPLNLSIVEIRNSKNVEF